MLNNKIVLGDLKAGEQEDSSIIDNYGNVMNFDDRIDILETVSSLPVNMFKDDILKQVQDNPITIIQGETGSGKSTQVPQILKPLGTIVNTQPRVISARSLASRVSNELMADTGNPNYTVGFNVGFRTGQEVSSKHTSPLSFHTDGLELMRQSVSGLIPDITILDEVHKYSIPTEILSMLLVDTMKKIKTKTKLVLMSATLDPQILQNYFKSISLDIPVIKVPGRTFPVEKYFNTDGNYIATIAKLYNGNEIKGEKPKNILLFVEGKAAINENIKKLKLALNDEAIIYPLHSELPIDEQISVLKKTNDKNIIIVSTNIAEESITIDYLDVVIDLGKHKTSFYNDDGIQTLITENISKASSMQRAGRCGRTKPGTYIRQNTKPYNDLEEYEKSPIEKEMLDRYILIALSDGIDIGDLIRNKKQPFIHKPSNKLLDLSYEKLRLLGAISSSNKITKVGIDLLQYPLSVENALILNTYQEYGFNEDILIITAILEKDRFLSPENLKWKKIINGGFNNTDNNTDLIYYLELYKILTSREISTNMLNKMSSLGVFNKQIALFQTYEGEKMFFEVCDLEQLGIKSKKIFEIYNLVEILKTRISNIGYDIVDNYIIDNIDNLKKSLLSGYLNNIFRYNKKDNLFYDYKNNYKYGFKIGKLSQINKKNNSLYIGSPFIIGGEKDDNDLNILSNITEIGEEHISEFNTHLAGETFSMFGLDENRDEGKINVSKEDIGNFWIESIKSDFNLKSYNYESREKLIGHLALNWLPYYLINYNHYIKKYIDSKSNDFNVPLFTQLLKKITILEKHRINPSSLEKTAHSFDHDTTILEMFLSSSDIQIKSFLEGKTIQVSNNVDNNKSNDSDGFIFETQELIKYKKEYFVILNLLKNLELNNNQNNNQIELLNSLLIKSIKKTDMYIYLKNDIKNIIEYINELDGGQRKKITSKIKSNSKDHIIFTNNIGLIKELKKGRKLLKKVFSGEIMIKDIDLTFLHTNLTDKKSIILKSIIKLLSSNDNRKVKRGFNKLQLLLIDINSIILKTGIENDGIKEIINSDFNEIFKNTTKSIDNLLSNIFNKNYFNLNIKNKIYGFIYNMVKSASAGKELNKNKVINDFILSFDLKFVNNKILKNKFIGLSKYDDNLYVLDAYKNQVLDEVKKTRDLEYIKEKIDKLNKVIDNTVKLKEKYIK